MKKLTAGLLLLTLFALSSIGVSAEDKNSSNFSVEPILTKDQVVTQKAYQHIRAKENTTYTLKYNIVNKSDKPLEISITKSNMLTSPQGQYYFETKSKHAGSTINKNYKLSKICT
jgi:hypothetical protein